jgi:uncharacterized membrane protein HdeD (DUF308 family)
MDTSIDAVVRKASLPSLFLSIVLIVFGVLAIALPIVTSFGVVIVVGWLAVFGGVVQVVHAFQSTGIGHIVWKLVVAAVYIAIGGYLLTHPIVGISGLTLALAIFFMAEGAADVIAYLSTPSASRSGWMLLDGIVTLALCLLIWNQWPYNSLWVIGFLVGINMMMTGITRLMMVLSVRRLARVQDERENYLRRAA